MEMRQDSDLKMFGELLANVKCILEYLIRVVSYKNWSIVKRYMYMVVTGIMRYNLC